MDVLSTYNTRATPQSQQADPRQERNAAGGYTFVADADTRLRRFLTLGTEGGTYYTSAPDLTADNAAVVRYFCENRPVDLVREIVDISMAGRAPRQNPAIFALAMCAGLADEAGRARALAALPAVCRTGTHLFLFVRYIEQFRGWGPALKRAVGRWYTDKPADKLAYQLVKYRQREGISHRDVLRLAKPTGVTDPATRIALNWTVGKGFMDLPFRGAQGPVIHDAGEADLAVIMAFEEAQRATTAAQWVRLVNAGSGLSWEMLPDAALAERDVWDALLNQGMPQTALMRQLPRLTNLGLTKGTTGRGIAEQLADPGRLKKARVHPINVLVAQRTYASGYSTRGSSTWTPDRVISDALDAAFYNAFGSVEPANKRTLLALDVSGSMGAPVSGLPLSCRDASAALAMVTAAVESDYRIVGFTGGPAGWSRSTAIRELDISPRRRLDDIGRYMDTIPFGRTDCALPMLWAAKNKVPVDTFHIYTDNETWYGNVHPHQALSAYRQKMGIDARLVVVAMTATGSSITDPTDPLQLDVSGFDSAVPDLLSAFSRGDI